MLIVEFRMRIFKVDFKIYKGKFKFNIKEDLVFCIY